jgi:hypothetical protein
MMWKKLLAYNAVVSIIFAASFYFNTNPYIKDFGSLMIVFCSFCAVYYTAAKK